jgi:hypothetical protein
MQKVGNAMILLKSIFAGLIGVLIAAIVLPIVIVIYFAWRFPPHKPGEAAVGFDLVSVARWPVTWIVAAIIFSLGFYWEYRRLKAP